MLSALPVRYHPSMTIPALKTTTLAAALSAMVLGACATPPRKDLPPPDELGRQLYGKPHTMSAEQLDELRENVSSIRRLDDQQAMRLMHMMGPDYTWYLSDRGFRDPVGVLILGHGFQSHGDSVLRQRMAPLADDRPTALALGMSMTTSEHVQLALDELTNAGAKHVIVIPAVSTRHNSMARQWDYILGRRDDAAYTSVPQVETRAKLHFVNPLEDHPLVGDTLVQYAREISRDPPNEELVIVAHGPIEEDDNRAQIAMLENLAAYIDERSDYAGYHVMSMQDDAPPEVRQANAEELRRLVSDITARGRQPLLVSSLLGTRTVQSSLRRHLRGLSYRFNPRGLMEHENFIRWIEQSVDDVVAANPRLK